VTGTANVMPMHESAMVEVTMETEPVQIEWSVVPTTIEDKYDIQLDLTFETNIQARIWICSAVAYGTKASDRTNNY